MDRTDTVARFRELEEAGLVRLRFVPEEESYFDVYGEPDTKEERDETCRMIDLHGLYSVIGEVKRDAGPECPTCHRSDREGWEVVDSCGMIFGNDLEPSEGSYVLDIMSACVKATVAVTVPS